MFGLTPQEKNLIQQFTETAKSIQVDLIQKFQQSVFTERGYTDNIILLKKKNTDLEIQVSKKEEEFARRERELTHMIGLEQKRQEQETTLAKRDAVLTIREESLAKAKADFESMLKFHEDRFTQETGYLKDLMTQIMKRLPDVNVALGSAKESKG